MCKNCKRVVGKTVLATIPAEKKSDPPIQIIFMAGMCSTGLCFWCEFDGVGKHLLH